mgnify:CR=1 FL=1
MAGQNSKHEPIFEHLKALQRNQNIIPLVKVSLGDQEYFDFVIPVYERLLKRQTSKPWETKPDILWFCYRFYIVRSFVVFFVSNSRRRSSDNIGEKICHEWMEPWLTRKQLWVIVSKTCFCRNFRYDFNLIYLVRLRWSTEQPKYLC